MCLARNIRYLRLKKHYSQDEVARKLGYKSYTTIQKWESGVSEPPVGKLRALAELLGADINDITSVDLERAESESNNRDQDGYYMDEDTRQIAQFMKDNPRYKVLFDSVRSKVKPSDIDFVREVIERMGGDNNI